MQLKVKINIHKPVTFPINYHHIQQALLYQLMCNDDSGKALLHDQGSRYLNREYKLFTFGPFQGKYSLANKNITFQDQVSFEVRSYDEEVIRNIDRNIGRKGIRLGDSIYHDIETELVDYCVFSSDVVIRMVSPICVYETDSSTNQTNYYSPQDYCFEEKIMANFKRKYIAAIGKEPGDRIKFEVLKVKPKDKYLTRYKGFLIEGWRGIYNISGSPDLITFLYNTGLGAKNSQGFGMFEVIS